MAVDHAGAVDEEGVGAREAKPELELFRMIHKIGRIMNCILES